MLLTILLPALLAAGPGPHHEQLAPSVYATGFSAEFSALQKAGVKLVTSAEGVQSIPYAGGVAFWLADKKVLFAGPASINGPRAVLPGHDTAEWIQTLAKL